MAMHRQTADIRTVNVTTPVRVILPDGCELELHRNQRMEMKVEEGEGNGNWSVTLTQVQDELDAWKRLDGELKRHRVGAAPFDVSSIPPGTFEAAQPRRPKLPEVTIPVSVDAILGVDAELRNAIFQMRRDDMHNVRVALQRAIKIVEPLFDQTAVALTASRATVIVKASDLKGGETPMRVRRAIMEGRARWADGENEGDLKELLAARDKAAGFRWLTCEVGPQGQVHAYPSDATMAAVEKGKP